MTKKFAVNFWVYYQNTQSVSEMKTTSRKKKIKNQSFNCHDQLKIYASKITSLKHSIDVTSPVLTLNHCFIYYCLTVTYLCILVINLLRRPSLCSGVSLVWVLKSFMMLKSARILSVKPVKHNQSKCKISNSYKKLVIIKQLPCKTHLRPMFQVSE